MLVLSIFTMIFALALMLLEMTTSDRVVEHPESDKDNMITVPENGDPEWDRAIGDRKSHKYLNDADAEKKFINTAMPVVPTRPTDPTPTNANPQPSS